MELNVTDTGLLIESILMQLELIRNTKAEEMPKKSQEWWLALHLKLNDAHTLWALGKQAADKEDEQILEILGIL